jgi:glycerophosphoryl diester phosphodiesterase
MTPRVRTGPPIGFGHRGALAYARENTIEGFKLALGMGATGIETDAWLAADGVPVLVHDRTIRPPGRRIFVTRRSSTELAAWGVPTLAQLYAECGTLFELSLDVEHPEVGKPIVAVARAAGALDRLWLCHPDLEVLADLRTHERRVHLARSVDLRARPAMFEAYLDRMIQAGVEVLNMRWRTWSSARLAAVHERGLLGFAWDVVEPATMAWLLELGIDAIYSDYPDRIARAIADYAAGAVPASAAGAP